MSNFCMKHLYCSLWKLSNRAVLTGHCRPCTVTTVTHNTKVLTHRLPPGCRPMSSPPSDPSDFNREPAADDRPSKRKSWRQFTSKKLHNRMLTEEEKALDKTLREDSTTHSLSEQDVFGTLQRSEVNHSHASRESKNWHKAEPVESTSVNHQADVGLTVKMQTKPEKSDSQSTVLRDRVYSTGSSQRSVFRSRRQADRYADTFGTLQQDEFEDKIQESLYTTVGSHEERLSGKDNGDEDPYDRSHIRLSHVNRHHIPTWYGRKITRLNKRGRVREALELFEEQMLKKDRVMPNAYVFTSLITGLGHAGYTKKAFHLFNRMKKMGIDPKPHTYTALFNACANSPWPQDGLTRADSLYCLMQERGVRPTFITGKAMIKAFARCGDVRRAFALMDKLSKTFRPDPEMFSSLLMACVSDKEAGLRHAIQVWRLMQHMQVKPDLPLYNLLIRCIRDCGVGDATSLQDLLGITAPQTTSEAVTDGEDVATQKVLQSGNVEGSQPKRGVAREKMKGQIEDSKQKILDPTSGQASPRASQLDPTLGQGSFAHEESQVPDSKHSRKVRPLEQDTMADADSDSVLSELEVGSRSSLLQQKSSASSVSASSFPEKHKRSKSLNALMERNASTQSTYTTIPDLLSPNSDLSSVISLGDLSSKQSQLALVGGVDGILARMVEDGVQPNTITFSQMIAIAEPTVEAEEQLLMMMKKMKVKPDIDLLNALIHKRCMRRDFEAAKEVQQLISEYKLTANLRTFGVLAMTCQSQPEAAELLEDMEAAELQPNMEILGTLVYSARTNFRYMQWVIREAQKLDLPPNKKFLQNVESALAYARKMIIQAEAKEDIDSYFLTPHFQESYEQFVKVYERWLQRTGVDIPSHPWAPFKPKQDDEDGENVVSKTV